MQIFPKMHRSHILLTKCTNHLLFIDCIQLKKYSLLIKKTEKISQNKQIAQITQCTQFINRLLLAKLCKKSHMHCSLFTQSKKRIKHPLSITWCTQKISLKESNRKNHNEHLICCSHNAQNLRGIKMHGKNHSFMILNTGRNFHLHL